MRQRCGKTRSSKCQNEPVRKFEKGAHDDPGTFWPTFWRFTKDQFPLAFPPFPFHRKVCLQIQRAKASVFSYLPANRETGALQLFKLVKIGTKTREYIRGDSFLPRRYVLEHTPGQSRKRRNEGKDKKDTKDRAKIAGRKWKRVWKRFGMWPNSSQSVYVIRFHDSESCNLFSKA